jgi:hypothetical protein
VNADGSLVEQWLLRLRFLVGASRRWSWRSLKDCISTLIGRHPFVDEDDVFVRQAVLHLTGLRPIRKITCAGPGMSREGAGSQALMVMDAINFARSFGLTYVHTPFTLIHHADRPRKEWATAWETFFNLGAGEVTYGVGTHETVEFSSNIIGLDTFFGWSCRTNELAHNFKAMIPEFRRKYYLNKSPRMTDEVTVAVHVRRGDAFPDNPGYYTSNEAILRTVSSVKAILDAREVNHRISVYSQGDYAEFLELSLPGVEFLLDVDALWTLKELIEADILIMAKGYFSYYAGIISDGIKIFEPMVPPPNGYFGGCLPSWKLRSLPPSDDWFPSLADGSFDCANFERHLSLLIQAKAAVATSAVDFDRVRDTHEATTGGAKRLSPILRPTSGWGR